MKQPRIFSIIDKAVFDYNMIEKGDRILVGASGGKDSTVLIEYLANRARRKDADFSFTAIHIETDFQSCKMSPRLRQLFDEWGVESLNYYVDVENQAIEWICFGPNNFNTVLPMYTNVESLPKYVSGTTLTIDSTSFYWQSRLIGALADPYYGSCIQMVERYQNTTLAQGHELVNKYDKLFTEKKDLSLLNKANEEVCKMGNKETMKVLDQLLLNATAKMKNGYNRADN